MRQHSPKSGSKGWHKADIVAAVRKKGSTITAVCHQAGIADGSRRACLSKPHPSANRVIAQFLGVSVHTLWPEWYDAQGNRIPGANHKITHTRSLCQKSKPTLASTRKKCAGSASKASA